MAFAGLGPPPAPAPSRVVDLQSWPTTRPNHPQIVMAGGVDESACGADTTVATTTNAPLAWPSVLSTPAG
ncbi:hypothetical protein SCP_0115260 [Sparassis crispa]|uniref:Uncharacterized protein n=1 Tax=Sparassis crispa TaxID=139825 RepID=A0A401G8Z7_9APHY|nr:hypothetical protein SCP_0115260 [Sparassis crispa]GBE78637.1 hypothetical protein SCP_0115260 [Sparassis crispa]